MQQLSPIIRSLRHRNFLLFFIGQLISLIGTWMQSVAQSWLIYRLTGSAMLLGVVSFAGQIPIFLFSPLGGAFADHHNRHRLVIATQTLSMILALILAGLTLSGRVREWHIIILASCMGIVNAFDIPARQSFLVDMVGREDLMNAIALNSSMFNGARIVGPAVAGILVSAIGEGWCFFANGVSYIAVIAGLLMMKLNPWQRSAHEGSTVSKILEGFRYVARTQPIRALLLLLGFVSLAGMPYTVLMPIFADQILHGGAKGLGLLMGAAGIGALAGALLLASRTGIKGLGKWVLFATVSFGVSVILFSLSRNFWISVLLLIPAGFALMVQMGSCNTLIQTMVADRLRGRVMSVYSMMFMGMAPIGALLAGTFAHRFGAPAIVFAGGVICILTGVLFGLRLPVFRTKARKIIAEIDPQQIITQ